MSQPRTLTHRSPLGVYLDGPIAGRAEVVRSLMGIRYTDASGTGQGAGTPAGTGQQAVAAAAPGTPAAPAPGADPAPAPAGPPSPAAVAAALAAQGAPGQQPTPGAEVRFEDLDPTTQAYVVKHRTEAATARQELVDYQAKEADRQAAFLKSLGLQQAPADTPKTPEQLAAEIQAQQQTGAQAAQERDSYARQAALARVALLPQNLVNVDKLLDSQSFTAKLSKVETTDTQGLQALITEAVTNDPSLRIQPVAGGSGSTQHGGTVPTTGRKNMGDAVKSRLSGAN